MGPIKQCDIWLLDFDPAIGQEIRKTRPALVISNDYYNIGSGTIFVIPLTSSTPKEYTRPFFISLDDYRIEGLETSSYLSISQFRSISKLRFQKKIGSVDPLVLKAVGKKFMDIMQIDVKKLLQIL